MLMCIYTICGIFLSLFFFFFKQKSAYEMRISDWSSDVCSSDLHPGLLRFLAGIDLEVAVRASALALHLRRQGVRQLFAIHRLDDIEQGDRQIGRASCRERVCQYV